MQFIRLYYVLFIISFSFALVQIPINNNISNLDISSTDRLSLSGSLELGDIQFRAIETDNGAYTQISLSGFHTSNLIGHPQLPEIHKLIEIPQNSNPVIKILNQEVDNFSLKDYGINNYIFPYQPSLSKSQTLSDVEI